MTKKWSNRNLPGALHYLTGNVINRVPAFHNSKCCKAFLEVFRSLLTEWPCKVISYVLMPEHTHFIVNPQDGDIKGFAGALKSLSAKKIVEVSNDPRFMRNKPDVDGSIRQVWQESFKAMPLWSEWMIRQKIDYIHANPVTARLVRSAQDYPWSSFRAFYEGIEEPLAVDHNWWWEDDVKKLKEAMLKMGWLSYYKRIDK
jgi:REP element-mobilizing transposase RayT